MRVIYAGTLDLFDTGHRSTNVPEPFTRRTRVPYRKFVLNFGRPRP